MAYEKIMIRITMIETQVSFIQKWIPRTFKEYQTDSKTQAAIERYLQTSIEALLEICIQMVKYFELGTPNSVDDVLELLSKNVQTTTQIKSLKKFRNVLVHQYDTIKNELVFDYIPRFVKDIKIIIKELKQILSK